MDNRHGNTALAPRVAQPDPWKGLSPSPHALPRGDLGTESGAGTGLLPRAVRKKAQTATGSERGRRAEGPSNLSIPAATPDRRELKLTTRKTFMQG